jgi:hypothetical protein
MPNKRISELPYITTNEISGNTLIPLVTYYSAVTGDTVHTTVDDFISFTTSATSISSSSLYNLYINSGLTPNTWYEITDFQTIYDQPDYDVRGVAKTNTTTYTSTTEPILVYATSNSTFNKYALQPSYPNDTIAYDINFTATEVMSVPAKGRIIERIDEYNNRTDYDHRNVLFKRYEEYRKNAVLTGNIVSYDSTTGAVSGTSTLFLTELTPGQIFIFNDGITDIGLKVSAVTNNENLVAEVDPDFTYTVTGLVSPIYDVLAMNTYSSYKEMYVTQSLDLNYGEDKTFQIDNEIITFGYAKTQSTYIGDYFKYKDLFGFSYLLSNNVFGLDCPRNTFGDITFNNTFLTQAANNKIKPGFARNNIRNIFNDNNIGQDFYDNLIDPPFTYNTINGIFSENLIYDDGFSTGAFTENVVNNNFGENITAGYFYLNTINAFVSGTDFTTATHVYNSYNCTIFQNATPTLRLSYFDTLDNLVITNINL